MSLTSGGNLLYYCYRINLITFANQKLTTNKLFLQKLYFRPCTVGEYYIFVRNI